jgi:alpha-methylacyl-CoA racemase
MDQEAVMTQESTGRTGPLAGVKVVEFAGIGPVPFAAMHLTDMGADVVRLVRPGTADETEPTVINRGRTTIVIDLKNGHDLAGVRDLLKGADILLEGFRPGVMERLGLGPDIMLELNPRLVFGRMTGWGQEGPLADAAGHDINYIAVTGALAAIGPHERPFVPLNMIGDYGGGAMYLLTGVLAALIHARATGQGQVIDCAMCDGAASLMSVFYEMLAKGAWNDRRGANSVDGASHYYNVFECADGAFIALDHLNLNSMIFSCACWVSRRIPPSQSRTTLTCGQDRRSALSACSCNAAGTSGVPFWRVRMRASHQF